MTPNWPLSPNTRLILTTSYKHSFQTGLQKYQGPRHTTLSPTARRQGEASQCFTRDLGVGSRASYCSVPGRAGRGTPGSLSPTGLKYSWQRLGKAGSLARARANQRERRRSFILFGRKAANKSMGSGEPLVVTETLWPLGMVGMKGLGLSHKQQLQGDPRTGVCHT